MAICRRFCTGKIMNKHLVFVYGTLKKAETVKKYPLVIASRYNIPFLLDSPGNGENVRGEVYEVDDSMLGALDILEDHPTLYVREMEKVVLFDDETASKDAVCWIYFLKKFKPELLSQNYFKEYRSRGSHGKPYAERELRDPGYSAKSDVLLG